MMTTDQAHRILGTRQGDDDATIRDAYRRAAHRHHPDRGGDPDQFSEVAKAYHSLTSDAPSTGDTPWFADSTAPDPDTAGRMWTAPQLVRFAASATVIVLAAVGIALAGTLAPLPPLSARGSWIASTFGLVVVAAIVAAAVALSPGAARRLYRVPSRRRWLLLTGVVLIPEVTCPAVAISNLRRNP